MSNPGRYNIKVAGISGTGNEVKASKIDVTGIKNDHSSGENVKVHGDAGLVGGKHTFKDNASGIQNFKAITVGTSSSSDIEDAKKEKLNQKLSFFEKKYSSNPEVFKKKLLELSSEYEELEDYTKASELWDRAHQI